MNPIILDLEQGSEEWLKARLGVPTASRFKDILNYSKNGTEGSKRRDYRAELVSEILTGQQYERFVTRDMENGTLTEPLARLEYEFTTGNIVEETGLLMHPKLRVGASPDGLIGEDGGIEIKNRKLANHIHSLRTGEVPDEFMDQIDGCLWISNRKWWDYVSFAPELPQNAQVFIKRVERSEERIKRLKVEVPKFLKEVDEEVNFVKGYGQKVAA